MAKKKIFLGHNSVIFDLENFVMHEVFHLYKTLLLYIIAIIFSSTLDQEIDQLVDRQMSIEDVCNIYNIYKERKKEIDVYRKKEKKI